MASKMSDVHKQTTKGRVSELADAIRGNDEGLIAELLNTINLKLVEDPEVLLYCAVDSKISAKNLQLLVHAFNQNNIPLDNASRSNRTAFDDACIDGYKDGVEILIKAGANYQRKMPNLDQTYTYLNFYRQHNPNEVARINDLIADLKKTDKEDDSSYSFLGFITGCFDQFRADSVGKYEQLKSNPDMSHLPSAKKTSTPSPGKDKTS